MDFIKFHTCWKYAHVAALHVFPPFCYAACTVQYDSGEKEIVCACHGGVFDLNGKNVAGPPPKPLVMYSVNVRGDEIVVSRV